MRMNYVINLISSSNPNDLLFYTVYKSECDMPKVHGSCKGSFRRYYYDILTNECQLFSYGGCRGNKNNFVSQAICQQKCVQGTKAFFNPLSAGK